jgi:uncharacterized Tic20 family protein
MEGLPDVKRNKRLWLHLASLVSFPLLGFIVGPLLLSKILRDSISQKEMAGAVRFQQTIAAYAALTYVGMIPLLIIVPFFGLWTWIFIWSSILAAIYLFWIVMTIRAAIRANRGQWPEFPDHLFLQKPET